MIKAEYLAKSGKRMEQVWVSLGSNLGDRLAHLQQAVAELRRLAPLVELSWAYESEPVEFTAQPWFLNAVAALRVDNAATSDAPQLMLAQLLAIERAMGRRRDDPAFVPKGPRPIDLDIIFYGNRVIATPELTVPHPAMHLRRFVLEPMAEVAPDLVHPALRQSMSQLLGALPQDGPLVRRLTALKSPEE
jgi:2-amino-4-hydroxy-6-hydroxymethyldihydropteridine diphosphokinase